MMSKKITRKEFLEKSVKTVIAVAGITACGRLLSGEAWGASDADEIKVGADKFLISVEDLKKKHAVTFMYNGKKSILLCLKEEIRAFENICTHKGGPNKLAGNKLLCQWHGATFDPLTGQATKPPAPKGSKLTAIKLEAKDGKIFLVS